MSVRNPPALVQSSPAATASASVAKTDFTKRIIRRVKLLPETQPTETPHPTERAPTDTEAQGSAGSLSRGAFPAMLVGGTVDGIPKLM